ncbi:MAG: hypothetical protein R2747_18020 [Pyrinomonadaceae bacterium]
MNKDLEHLKILSIFYYVVGVLIALFSCIPIIHLFMGLMFLTMDIPTKPGQPEFPQTAFGLAFTIIPLIFILGGWTLAVMTIVAGRKLSKQTNYTFCFVIAAILCAFMPFGTVLGVFTIIVLLRDSVKQLFERGASPSGFQGPNSPYNWK